MGMLVLLENYRNDVSSEGVAALREMIVRSRNRPSVIGWSLCNEVRVCVRARACVCVC